MSATHTNPATPLRPNGAGAATVLSAGIGTAVLGVLTLASDKSAPFKSVMVFYKPTGALSGVTTVSLVTWLLSWVVLHGMLSKRDVPLRPVVLLSFALLLAGLLFTFPPFIDAV